MKVKKAWTGHRLLWRCMTLDLKHNTITLGELLADPRSKAVLQRRFGQLLSHPLAGAAKSLTLAQLAEMAGGYLPKQTIQATLSELKAL